MEDTHSSLRQLCRLVISTHHNRNTPTICRWLINQDPEGGYRLNLHLLNDTRDYHPEYHPDTEFPTSVSDAPNITLILILSAIFIILLISALLTCNRKKRDSPTDYDGDSDSVVNMRIMTTLARLSRVHVVSVSGQHEDSPVFSPPLPTPPPPDYETVEQIKKREEEDLPSYCQAVTADSCPQAATSCHM